MQLESYVEFLRQLLGPAAAVPGEFGVTSSTSNTIRTIGYATNLTPETVASAVQHRVDLIITHHDAWEFVYGMKAECVAMLRRSGIAHLFAHLPLDAAESGTAAALGQVLGGRIAQKTAPYEGFLCGRICDLDTPVPFADFVARVERACEEKVQSWRNSDRPITRFGVVPGGGHLTGYVKECVDHDCDLYITGEKSLYTVQYADYARINLIVGSHTFTEIFGVRALVDQTISHYPEVKAVRLHESHMESTPMVHR